MSGFVLALASLYLKGQLYPKGQRLKQRSANTVDLSQFRTHVCQCRFDRCWLEKDLQFHDLMLKLEEKVMSVFQTHC